ncbi:hypothetical protein SADUNF_Sadunf13G0041100 [Salix dunnii]|uniref:Uncharacterized protein n=1 Tax=Salix dunnii TaxID=1413687 RepID=A0A835MN66_9ROSI|nr:hypothetical protein SADUNF_Sadunf13G0041100 [Salix dunnii]
MNQSVERMNKLHDDEKEFGLQAQPISIQPILVRSHYQPIAIISPKPISAQPISIRPVGSNFRPISAQPIQPISIQPFGVESGVDSGVEFVESESEEVWKLSGL